jgi:hypothetical protein
MALADLLNPTLSFLGSQTGGNLLGNLFGSQGSTSGAQSFTGLGRGAEQLLGAGALGFGTFNQPSFEIPNFADFASPRGDAAGGFLQNQFESPVNPFDVEGVFNRFLPLIERGERAQLERTRNAILAGRPQSLTTAIAGPEIGAVQGLEESFRDRRNSLIGELMLANSQQRQQAATSLLGFEKLGQVGGFEAALQGAQSQAEAQVDRNTALSGLGLELLQGRQPGAGGAAGGAGGGGLGGVGGVGTAGGGAGGAGGTVQAITDLLRNNPSLVGQLTNVPDLFNSSSSLLQGLGLLGGSPQGLFSTLSPEAGATFTSQVGQFFNAPVGAFEELGNGAVSVLGEDGQTLGTIDASGNVLGAGGSTLGNLAGEAGGILAAGGGMFHALGQQIGKLFAGPDSTGSGVKSFLGGAAGGAGLGFKVGGPIGALVGGIAGGIGGLFGERGARQERKQGNIEFEAQRTSELRPGVLSSMQDMLSTIDRGMPRLQQIAPADTSLTQLIQSGDPDAQAVFQQAKAAMQQPTGGEVGGLSMNTSGQNVISTITAALAYLRRDTPASSGGQSIADLINKSDTGSFDPGVQALQQRIRQTDLLMRAAASLDEFAQRRGLI